MVKEKRSRFIGFFQLELKNKKLFAIKDLWILLCQKTAAYRKPKWNWTSYPASAPLLYSLLWYLVCLFFAAAAVLRLSHCLIGNLAYGFCVCPPCFLSVYIYHIGYVYLFGTPPFCFKGPELKRFTIIPQILNIWNVLKLDYSNYKYWMLYWFVPSFDMFSETTKSCHC